MGVSCADLTVGESRLPSDRLPARKGSVRNAVVRAARRIGVEPQLRLMQTFVGSTLSRQNRLDDVALLRLIRSLPPAANCIDVGANRGGVLAWIVHACPNGHHYAFEPLPDLAEDLRRRFPSVSVIDAALADASGTSTFYRAGSDAQSTLSGEPGGKPIDVRTARLDDELPSDYTPALLKVDVEGAEALVFEGAQELLRRARPTVFFEHGTASRTFFDIPSERVHDLLAGCGYRIYDRHGRSYGRDELTDARVWNFIART
jgi:FkbM family methyltransferase